MVCTNRKSKMDFHDLGVPTHIWRFQGENHGRYMTVIHASDVFLESPGVPLSNCQVRHFGAFHMNKSSGLFTQSREIQSPNHVKLNKNFTFHVTFYISFEDSIIFPRFTHKCIFTLSRDLFCIFKFHI
jgi:hypothetical protein